MLSICRGGAIFLEALMLVLCAGGCQVGDI
jgi:hypothetical protein